MTRQDMMTHEKSSDWFLFENDFNTPPTAPVPFEHHTEAQDWVNANATGRVCVADRAHGRMVYYPEGSN